MKTPQQIRNEVEKGCGKIKGKVLGKDYLPLYCGDLGLCNECQARLSILSEYDKSIKEMIEEYIKSLSKYEYMEKDGYCLKCGEWKDNLDCINKHEDSFLDYYCETSDVQGALKMLKELLSKIGDGSDNSQNEKATMKRPKSTSNKREGSSGSPSGDKILSKIGDNSEVKK